TRYDTKLRALLAWNASAPDVVRAFGCSKQPTSYETTLDSGKASAPRFPGRLAKSTLKSASEPVGILHLSHRLKPDECIRFFFYLSFSLEARRGIGRTVRALPPANKALAETQAYYDRVLNRAVVMTPDQHVNRGVFWAKANMLRAQLLSPTGWCFVNDPTRSNNSVARDTAWFAFGADYTTPEFARESLLWYADHLERRGLVVEYYDIRTGESEDYGLNINDNTPLLILALWHHYTTTGDEGFLRQVYRKALKAARYILSQRNEQGLVWCTGAGSAEWGIVGWRNVIENYRLSGATTELNSECYAALATVSQMAHVLRRHGEAAEFRAAAESLKDAINTHLLNPRSGLYYLTIDLEGNPRTDITVDLVFPVMFGVADDVIAAHIIGRLSVPEFWSEAGIHTVPRNDISYGPTHGYGLLGGVWVAVTFWYAFAAARFNPQFMAYALSTSFRHYSQDPRRNNTVPGQFSEWLHGETLTNQGMMLSPWFPPRYLWAAIEGAAGLELSGPAPRVHPRLAPDWHWLGVRNVPLRGRDLTWFVVRTPELRMYANFQSEQAMPMHVYDEDVTDLLGLSGDSAVTIGLRKGDSMVVFIGNTSDRTTMSAWRMKVTPEARYAVRTFNSLRGAWVEGKPVHGRALQRGVAVQLDRQGFCVMELREEL
ncbi:MAG: hypothetical protein JO060_06465, partial [Candidatus Eremiobacteraeota bacterium]|nr:hypothetical protein [Candidatus Eremiobacteraeota bacterium]